MNLTRSPAWRANGQVMTPVRAVAHLFGWHSRACRGDMCCYRPDAKRFNRWGWYA